MATKLNNNESLLTHRTKINNFIDEFNTLSNDLDTTVFNPEELYMMLSMGGMM